MDGALGRAPPIDEVTMADVVPLDLLVDIRQEILTVGADDKAMKIREKQEVRVKVQRSLQGVEVQGFRLFHPQVSQARQKKEEMHKALAQKRANGPGSPEVQGVGHGQDAGQRDGRPGADPLIARGPGPMLGDRKPGPVGGFGLGPGGVGGEQAGLDELRQALQKGLFWPLEIHDPQDRRGTEKRSIRLSSSSGPMEWSLEEARPWSWHPSFAQPPYIRAYNPALSEFIWDVPDIVGLPRTQQADGSTGRLLLLGASYGHTNTGRRGASLPLQFWA